MSQQPYSDKVWPYTTPQDYGLGDTTNGITDIPLFMMRMMLKIKQTAPGNPLDKYKYAFRKTADHFYRKGYIDLMTGKVELRREGLRYEIESRQKTHYKGVSNVTDGPEKLREFTAWVKQATVDRDGPKYSSI